MTKGEKKLHGPHLLPADEKFIEHFEDRFKSGKMGLPKDKR